MKSKNEVFDFMKSKGYSISKLEKLIMEMQRHIISIKASIQHCEKFPKDVNIFFVNCENLTEPKKELNECETHLEWIIEFTNNK
jgi:hypothetical protein